MKTDLFQSCGHCWVIQICWHIECNTFTASCFRILNNSAEISSPQLALFIVMLPKDHLTSHSRMSCSSWVITPSWLSGSLRLFLLQFCACHLFLISFASVRFLLFLSFTIPILAWNVPLVSLIFLKRSLIFPILSFSSISLHCSVKKAFLPLTFPCSSLEFYIQSDIFLPFSLAFCLSFFLSFVKPLQTTTEPSCISFSFWWLWSLPPCTMLPTSVHSSSGTLPTRSNAWNLFITSSAQS